MSQQTPPSSPGKTGRFLIVILVVFATFLLIRILSDRLPGPDESANQPGVGRSLPMLELQPLDDRGPNVKLEDLQGKVVLLNFWGTWCPPCLLELPHIAALHEQLADTPDFRLLAVSCGRYIEAEQFNELRETTHNLLAAHQWNLPSYADMGGTTRRAVEMATGGYLAYPTTLLLDRNLTIRGIWIGYEPYYVKQMQQRIGQLLAERALPASSDDSSA
jgi:thiol-disulfide isomerase/thioredoxin